MDFATSFIIPFASNLDESCQATIRTLILPNLVNFLGQAEVIHVDSGNELDFIPPHERILDRGQSVIVTPCHWSVGIDNIRMENPEDLQLTDEESRTLFTTLAPYFEEDGITLRYQSATVWYADSPLLDGVTFASLDRVIGRHVDTWQPQTEESKIIRRLQNEMQMLLYTHTINIAREAKGLLTVNSFWLSRMPAIDNRFKSSLRDSALSGDWHAWAAAWRVLDQELDKTTKLTLCGERHAVTYQQTAQSQMFRHLRRIFAQKPNIHKILQNL